MLESFTSAGGTPKNSAPAAAVKPAQLATMLAGKPPPFPPLVAVAGEPAALDPAGALPVSPGCSLLQAATAQQAAATTRPRRMGRHFPPSRPLAQACCDFAANRRGVVSFRNRSRTPP